MCQRRELGGHHLGTLGKVILVLQDGGVVLRIPSWDAPLPACRIWGEMRGSTFLLLLCPWNLLNVLLPSAAAAGSGRPGLRPYPQL